MDAKQIEKAIAYFWDTKAKQLVNSGDSSNRGSVVGGKQMDGFVELLRDVAIHAGIPEKYIITDNNYLRIFPLVQGLGYVDHFSNQQTDSGNRIEITNRFIQQQL